MDDTTKRAWLALHRTPSLSQSMLRRLSEAANGDPQLIASLSPEALAAMSLPAHLLQVLRDALSPSCKERRRRLEQDWRLINSMEIELVSLNDDNYPELLKQINDPPPLLYIRGNSALLAQPQIAMVGSRKASRQGCENAYRIASDLAAAGFVVTSGLAAGIDTHAHMGALASGDSTIAVLGTGVDRPYPASNHSLYRQVVERGVVLSEFVLGSEPIKGHFPQRNRVISGLSLGVLVVEAAPRSGSLISARLALEQNREVFAIPGSIHNPNSRGCHALIRQGANLVESAQDVMEPLVGWTLPQGQAHADTYPETSHELSSTEQTLLDMLGYDPASMEQLQHASGWSVATLNTLLVSLEFKGLVENLSGLYQRVSKTL